MLEKICLTAGSISPKITLVVGFDKDSVIKESKTYNLEISTADQPEPIGTGDAVKCGITKVEDGSKVLVLYGDVPLIKKDTLKELINSSDDGLSILTTILENPYGYGRVKKDDSGNALAIVEEKDASADEKNIKEIFTGVLCGKKELIEEVEKEVWFRRFALDVSILDVNKIDAVNVKTVVLSTSFHWIIQVMSLQECQSWNFLNCRVITNDI